MDHVILRIQALWLLLLLKNVYSSSSIVPFPSRQGKEQNKPEVIPLHIQNPFETTLNVSKNVSSAQLDRFVALCQESMWQLQNPNLTPSAVSDTSTATPWGLAALLMPSQVVGVKSRKKWKKEPTSEMVKSLLESLKTDNKQQKS